MDLFRSCVPADKNFTNNDLLATETTYKSAVSSRRRKPQRQPTKQQLQTPLPQNLLEQKDTDKDLPEVENLSSPEKLLQKGKRKKKKRRFRTYYQNLLATDSGEQLGRTRGFLLRTFWRRPRKQALHRRGLAHEGQRLEARGQKQKERKEG